MQSLCHQPGRAGSLRQLFLSPAVTSLPSREQDVLGQSPLCSLCRAPGTQPWCTSATGSQGHGGSTGDQSGLGICPWGPPLQEADPPGSPCNDEGLMAESTKAFSREIHSLWQTRKQKSICMSSSWQVLSKGKGKWSDACSHGSWQLFNVPLSW